MNEPQSADQTRVIVGMSGGVDSSVAALLCQQQGFQVEGLFMKNWEEDDGTDYCTAVADLEDAKTVCDRLGIKLNEANFAAEYWDNVFAHFLEEYAAGRTPNPDVLCNREIKFQVFAQYAKLLGADLIATGHYARLTKDSGRPVLRKALDENKDQSYFLQSVSAAQFENVVFPLGNLPKSEVREIARKHDLSTHAKKDSTGICFIGERRFKDFLKTYLPVNPGDIVDVDGNHMGRHEGLMYHTLGQRQGLGIGGVKDRGEAPWYVVAKDLTKNRLIVAQGNDHPALFCRNMTVTDIHWINESPALPTQLQVKTRYRQPDQICRIDRKEDGYDIAFDLPQRAVTPGQWACFYDGDVCLGGGIIIRTDAWI
ncbi:MAG: tRNA 2-thiouridine(34) synthase MnmA [Gammaproteobacteria bacterium]|jgi:tRNA-uridine 2-sulfurtransferase|nr:tRNA 2-thiouridine(34) synthase MnmA [Gammaproteobacteria bacterium]MBT7370563.1 tRNA 2-thiouridine(34) synthase MnmA [Gammaproteobacteria bacterium]